MSTPINKKYIDLSNGQEKIPILISKTDNAKLRKKYDHKKCYIISSYIKNGELDEYSLTKEYSCECINNECNLTTCSCILNHVQKYECNKNCSCKEDCPNRKVQNGITRKLNVKYISKSKGFGAFALEDIKKDDFICEYVGQIINKTFAIEKIERNKKEKKPNYILQVRENYEKIIINTFIDAEEYGNMSRFINHSCDPNLYFDFVRVNHFIPQVAFFAKKDIKEGEELAFSYCEVENNQDDASLSSKKCECGAVKCKKYLPS